MKAWQCLEINDARFVFPAVAGHSALKVGRGGKTVNARSVGYLAGDFFLVEVNHDDLRGVADVKAAVRFIHGQVIPTALTANGDIL